MDIWLIEKWQDYYKDHPCRSGLRVYYDKNVDPEVKRAIKECVAWLRREYVFPKRVRMYVKSNRRIKAKNGDMVCGTFFRPTDRDVEPYIRIATGDYLELFEQRGKDNALAAILQAMMHELSHYFQWLNDLDLTFIGEERQATNYSRRLMSLYAETRDHP
ncbi:MAG: hypothetical protein IJW92_05960 [Clostridia bacterium]|nr:hypothetical protein [Clostridia bacterium]